MLDFFPDDLKSHEMTFATMPTAISRKLPFYVDNIFESTQGSRFFTHRKGVDSYLILYTLDGSGILKVDGKTFLLNKDDVFFIDCKKEHFYKTDGDHWHYVFIHFDGLGAKGFSEILSENNPTILSIDREYFVNCLKQIITLFKNESILSYIQTSKIINNILCKLAESKFKTQNAFSIDEILIYISENYNKKIDINGLSSQFNLSSTHFSRMFKSYTGFSPYQYILNYRITQAKKLLVTTDLSIENITFEVGFNSPSFFIKAFKNFVGKPPHNFRKNTI